MRSSPALIAACLVVCAAPLAAQPKPVAKPAKPASPVEITIDAPAPIPAAAVSPRPLTRPTGGAAPAEPDLIAVRGETGFAAWLDGFRTRAQRAGVSPRVLDIVAPLFRYNPRIVELDRNQAEFSKPLWEYLDGAVSSGRIRDGQAQLARHGSTLDRIEGRYGVEKETVVAVWGLESSYGGFRGTTGSLGALATLAYDGRRGAFFEGELIAALKILQAGEVSPNGMVGSWAGAMGHTQFMPSSYLAHAVDFTGDGRRDVWSDDPTDALASTAAYLAASGWRKGQPWGIEVRLPQGFDYGLADAEPRPVAAWQRAGLRTVAGGGLPNHGQARLLLPAGARGPAFLTFENFEVIKTYNSSTSYALAVGHLGDRIGGGPAIAASWPRGDRALSTSEKRELQQRLTARGYPTQGIDGKIGPDTIAAIRRYQKSAGLLPDGYATVDLLSSLR